MKVDATPSTDKPKIPLPTVSQINADRITQLANHYWSPQTKLNHLPYDASIVESIYLAEILGSNFSVRRIMMLEFSQYLENYLWPYYETGKATHAHMMSIIVMINEKFRERVPAWQAFLTKPDHFPGFFEQVLRASIAEDQTSANMREQTALLLFLNHCFGSMEVQLCRDQVKRLVSLSMWISLQEGRRNQEFKNVPKWRKYWRAIQKKDKPELLDKLNWERHYLQRLMIKFMRILENIPETGDVDPQSIRYCERFLELMIDLEALLPTRRFFNTVMDDCHLVVRCQMAPLTRRPEGQLFDQLLNMLKFYARFEISDETGDPMSDRDMTLLHYSKITSLQKAAFSKFPDLRLFALANVASVDTRKSLHKHFGNLSDKALRAIATYLNLIPPEGKENEAPWHRLDKEFLQELLISRHERRISQLQELNSMPLYPTEEVIWDENVVPTEIYSGENCLALPKLNLQFLTLHDYLLRNFNLFRLESTYEIRQDIEDAVYRLAPWRAEDGSVYFGGWARMAHPITSFAVVEVAKPNIGETAPSCVRADVTVTLSVRNEIKHEWESLRKHDVCFLVTVRPTQGIGTKYDYRKSMVEQAGIIYVRGCEVEGMLDASGRVIEEGPEPRPELEGDARTFRLLLDPNQYRLDLDHASKGTEDVYETFNIVMRRKPKENNFKAVLETIRELMNTECVVPEWLHDIVLGYGDPGQAHYTRMPNEIPTLDFNDTFLDMEHLRSSFPGYEIKVKTDDPRKLVRPFKLTFENVLRKQKLGDDAMDEDEQRKLIIVEPHVQPKRGPYLYNEPKKNTIAFTPTQVEAIRSGMQPGLTLVVGPPGTGKTDVAVQIISNLYHNFPWQRNLVVTHSNQALNQLFEKIAELDVDERHLLRLGHGEEALQTDKDFSRYGRVNYVLAKRLELLERVGRLQSTLDAGEDAGATCELAHHFHVYHVKPRWEAFLEKCAKDQNKSTDTISSEFPFHEFFNDAPKPLFPGKSYDEDMEVAKSCYRYIDHIFEELEEFRAFELLRSGLDRSKYLLVKEAKIIAMTCTHAALKRSELVEMGFKYDNILMEESAQILEIETFIPLLLQNPQDGRSRLKRWIMIGDHHQLPPVVKNMAFQKYCNMEQSLFTRMVRLGVPYVELDAQGRARPSICNLYRWRYLALGDLGHVTRMPEYRAANAGLRYDFQLINVADFNGAGETEPSPYFYQNLAEAEYVVAVFMYMRMIGWPAERISILTTYNGQKHLIRDVIDKRCADNPLIGRPHKVTTVDKYQGQQNDIALVSLVRTKAVGHVRDLRRLIVAASRARLGLYVFARADLFRNCFELQPTFNQLVERPLELELVPGERWPAQRAIGANVPPTLVLTVKDMPHMAQFVYNMYLDRVKQCKDQYERSTSGWSAPGTECAPRPGEAPPSQHAHPGAADSDDEDANTNPTNAFQPSEIVNEVDDVQPTS